MKKWFPRGAGLKAALFWLLGPWVWGWGLDHMQLQMSGGGRGGVSHPLLLSVGVTTNHPAGLPLISSRHAQRLRWLCFFVPPSREP